MAGLEPWASQFPLISPFFCCLKVPISALRGKVVVHLLSNVRFGSLLERYERVVHIVHTCVSRGCKRQTCKVIINSKSIQRTSVALQIAVVHDKKYIYAVYRLYIFCSSDAEAKIHTLLAMFPANFRVYYLVSAIWYQIKAVHLYNDFQHSLNIGFIW